MDVETNRSALSPEILPLAPDLKNFIQRILEPMLVDTNDIFWSGDTPSRSAHDLLKMCRN